MKKEVLRNGTEVLIRRNTTEDLEAMFSLQEEVIQTLEDPSSLQPLSKEEFIHILEGNGIMLGAYVGEELIAFRALLIPSEDEPEHLGEDAGLETEELPQVIYSEISNVKPSFRGNRLQKILGRHILEEIDQAKFRYICATVAPFNLASLSDKFAQGLHIVALKKKYGGNLRYVFMRDFKAQPQETRKCKNIEMGNIEEQQALLEKGWRGVGLVQQGGQWAVKYYYF